MAATLMPTLLITMVNNCGFGDTILTNVSNENAPVDVNLATGTTSYLATGSVLANAYLNNGYCGIIGANCSTISINFNNGTTDAAIAVLPPYGFSAPFGFSFYSGGCNTGFWCNNTNCMDNAPPTVECTIEGQTGLVVLFCPSGSPSTSSASGPSSTSSPSQSASVSTKHNYPPAVIGGIISGVIIAVVIALFLFLYYRRRKQTSREETREKFEFRTRFSAEATNGLPSGGGVGTHLGTAGHSDPFKDPTPRSGSPAGASVMGEEPVQVVYSDSSMPFKEFSAKA